MLRVQLWVVAALLPFVGGQVGVQGGGDKDRGLYAEFLQAKDVAAKVRLLPALVAKLGEDGLPDEARFLLAIETLRPHLTWHAFSAPGQRDRRIPEQIAKELLEVEDPWCEALGADAWLAQDVPKKVKDEFRRRLEDWQPATPKAREAWLAMNSAYVWRLRNPKDAEIARDVPLLAPRREGDVARAVRLLAPLRKGEVGRMAQRWLREIARNNTALTFDVPPGTSAGKTLPLVMDVRNADEVSFKLYRVTSPETLVAATHGIGVDFVYRDHGLNDDERLLEKRDRLLRAAFLDQARDEPTQRPAVAVKVEDLVHQWSDRVVDLKLANLDRDERHRRWQRDDDDEDDDGWYFDDHRHERRVWKEYRPHERQPSSWRCDRLVQVAGKFLDKPGAYVLVAESNGQTAYVPLLVDPISLAMRRCRDGVFTLVSDAAGKQPLPGASIHAEGLAKPPRTNGEGAAFARVFAAGDRAIVARHGGRFAIGGFGIVFHGQYHSPLDDDRELEAFVNRPRILRPLANDGDAMVFGDRHVVAAYTDRPTYRPGQQAQFKLIVRKMTPGPQGDDEAVFRASDFDSPSKATLPDLHAPIDYAVLDPKGREIASGQLPLSDFGTAAGAVSLNGETALGAYSLRVRIAGKDRLVPGVFRVMHYRRPDFDVQLSGVPAKLAKAVDVDLKVAAAYYFGKPVAAGKVQVRVVRAGDAKEVIDSNVPLDDAGNARIVLGFAERLQAGKYLVQCTVMDESDRSVTKTLPLEIEPPSAKDNPLATLPRFLRVGEEWGIVTTAKHVRANHRKVAMKFVVEGGLANLRFADPGWYRVRAAGHEAFVYAYGDDAPEIFDFEPDEDPDGKRTRPHWVDLSHRAPNDERFQPRPHDGRPEKMLVALFDRQDAVVGGKLRVLVHLPFEQARLVFTMEGATVIDYFVTHAKGPFHVVEIPIKERHMPNFYLKGETLVVEKEDRKQRADPKDGLVKEKDKEDELHGLDLPWCRVDVTDPNRKAGGERLKVTVETERTEYRPGETVNVRLNVADLAGKPRAAEVSLGAVDESVYFFGEDGVAGLAGFFSDPIEPRRFYPGAWRNSLGKRADPEARARELRDAVKLAKQALEALRADKQLVEAAKNLAEFGDKLRDRQSALSPAMLAQAVPGAELPVGRIPLARLRQDFRETASWQPQLKTDVDGSLRTSFKLPDSLTRYRLTAVAITKETEIGSGRASLSVSMPLAVQLVLPRFGVQSDRLLAVGLVHNHTAKERTCEVQWDVDGADVDGRKTDRVVVPAKGAARVSLWLRLARLGDVKVSLRAADATDSDAESRILPVQPLGRDHEVAATGHLVPNGKATKETRFRLGDDFTATELNLSLSSTNLAQSLDGVQYLVDYPYGCAEQTMSRFLPAVMVKHATQKTPLSLPPVVAAKLPDVLAKGLTRLYGFQHTDGGWGWWEHDATNDGMSVYVVYGLARCKLTGTAVDQDVLDRGCTFLTKRLKDGDLAPHLAARAWHVLALAGRTTAAELQTWIDRKDLKSVSPEAACDLSLACRRVGLKKHDDRIWQSLRDWTPTSAESLALKLLAQVEHAAPWHECEPTATNLVRLRTGHYWQHTKATSAAIEALAGVVDKFPNVGVPERVRVEVDGKTVLDVKDPAELKKMVYRVNLTKDQLPGREGVEVRMIADSAQPMQFALRAVGVQRLDEARPTGDDVKVQRTFETLDGAPLTGPVPAGQSIRVRLRLDLAAPETFVMVEDRRPAGFEFADSRLLGAAAKSAANVEFRDDRVCAFFTELPNGRHELVYHLRAETSGISHVLPGCAYPMYAPTKRGETGSAILEVRER